MSLKNQGLTPLHLIWNGEDPSPGGVWLADQGLAVGNWKLGNRWGRWIGAFGSTRERRRGLRATGWAAQQHLNGCGWQKARLNGDGTEEQQPDKKTDRRTKNPNKTCKKTREKKWKKRRGKVRKGKAARKGGESLTEEVKASLRRWLEKKPRVFLELLSLKQNVSHDLNAIWR